MVKQRDQPGAEPVGDVMAFGTLKRQENMDAKFGASSKYSKVVVQSENGLEILLLTDSDLKRLRERSNKNPEDHLSFTLAERWCAWWCRMFPIIWSQK